MQSGGEQCLLRSPRDGRKYENRASAGQEHIRKLAGEAIQDVVRPPGILPRLPRCTGEVGRVEEDEIEALTRNRREQVTLTNLDTVLKAVEHGIEPCAAYRLWIDVNRDNTGTASRGNQRDRAGAGAQIQHPQVRGDDLLRIAGKDLTGAKEDGVEDVGQDDECEVVDVFEDKPAVAMPLEEEEAHKAGKAEETVEGVALTPQPPLPLRRARGSCPHPQPPLPLRRARGCFYERWDLQSCRIGHYGSPPMQPCRDRPERAPPRLPQRASRSDVRRSRGLGGEGRRLLSNLSMSRTSVRPDVTKPGGVLGCRGMNRRGIAVATLVIMSGTLITSLLGFVRAVVVARFFGQSASTDALFAALTVPQMFYDQLIGGAISAALIPSFSRLAAGDDDDLWLVVRTVFVLELMVVVVAVGVLELLAHPLMAAIASGFQLKRHAGTLPLAVKLVRVLLPTLLFSAMSAVALATLYSLGRRVVSAFAPSCYHLGIIVAALIGAVRWGITALAVGAVAGAAVQFAVQVPMLFRARRAHGMTGARQNRRLVDFRHPAIKRIVRLYLPIAAGMVVSIAGQIADINFKSKLPLAGELSGMQNATQLVQFPVGIVAAALAFAVLPTISVEAAHESLEGFKDTLALGMRMSLVLMVPAMVGFLVLATPVVALIFQRGHFTHLDTVHTATALIGYAPQLPFVGIDQLLIYAFYARHNTITPAMAGVVGVSSYVLFAAAFLGPLSIIGLALANTISIVIHVLVLFILVYRAVGPLSGRQLPLTVLKLAVAGGAMAAAAAVSELWLSPGGSGLAIRLADVVIPGAAAVMAYVACLVILRVDEARMVAGTLSRRFVANRG
jgi:putative peptidoglycan lipid II flippase